ncbi:MAG: helix-turn-helix domain-containing protein [Oceanicaulis sp.]
MEWGEELKAFRQRSGLKQESAAHLLGVSQAYISRLENGAATPSADLEERLSRLLTEPAHRPLYDHVRALVTYSPYYVSLISARDGKLVVEAASRALVDQPPFRGLEVGDVMNIDLGDEANGIVNDLMDTGAFTGEIAFAEVVWTWPGNGAEQPSHWKTVQVPLRKDGGDWVLHASNIEIAEAEKNRLIKDWGGKRMRSVTFEEAPAPPLL